MKNLTQQLVLVFILSSTQIFGQITVSNALTPAQLVQNVFVSPGVIVSNVTYNGSAAAANVPQPNVAEFTSGGAFVYGNGLLLTTGLSTGALGPNNNGALSLPGTADVSIDADLNTVAAALVTNGCVLEFDFLSTDNVVQMNYIFGSEEYPEWAPSIYNDVFGFFLSGPGIAGPYLNGAVNLALIPGSNTPVTINNVNATTNPAFYLDNLAGAAYGNEIQYDGTTVGLTAFRNIQCNATYHIKLAIANVGDQGWDSGVFFQAESFVTTNPNAISISFSDGGIGYEDCAPTNLNFSRTVENSINPVTINYLISGTAQANDYNAIPTSVTFAAGQTEVDIPIIPTVDNVAEGTETLIIEYSYLNSCGDPVTDIDTLYINDGPTVDAGPDVSYCIGDSVQLTGTVSGGTFAWSSPSMIGELYVLNPFISSNLGGTYTLTVTNPVGCVKTDDVIVTALQQPVAAFNTANNCLGAQTPFMDASAVDLASSIASWDWDFGDGQTSAVQDPVHTYSSEGNYNVQLIVTANSGCEDTIVNPQIVYPSPVASFVVPGVCEGINSEFTDASTVDAPDFITSWEWIFGDMATSADQNPLHLFASQDVYSNQLIVISNNGCSDTVSLENTVWPLPSMDFIFNDTCLQGTTNFINASTISSAITPNSISTWLWSFDDGNTLAAESGTYTYSNPGTYNVNLLATSENGCINNLEQVVIVHPNPNADFTVDAVCVNLASNFTDLSNVTGGDVITDWNWSFGDNTTSTDQNPTHLYSSENSYSTQLIVSTAAGCVDTANVDAIVYPRPFVDFDATNVCLGLSNLFTQTSSISNQFTTNSIDTWNYIFGDGANSNLANTDHLYSSDGIYNVYLVATSNHGCADSIQKPVSVFPKPNASFTGVELSGCSPVCPVIASTSTANAPGVITQTKWIYSDNYSEFGLYTNRCFENTSNSTQNYGVTLIVTSDSGCTDTVFSPFDYISVYHLPIADFSFTPNEPDILDELMEFNNLSSYASSYEWQIGNLMTSTMVNPTLDLTFEPATYPVQLVATTSENCTDTIIKYITINDVLIIHVPNAFTPNGDQLNQTFKPVIGSGVDLYSIDFYVFNRWGEMVFESHNVDFGWNGTYASTNVQTGAYTWELEFKVRSSGDARKMTGVVNLMR